jgi:PAN domain
MKASSELRLPLIPEALVRCVPRGGLAVLGVVLAGSCATVQPGPRYVASGAATLEANVDRPGGDYRDFDLASPQPEECRDTCAVEPRCVAFTFVSPGIEGPSARCWLKDKVPPPRPSAGRSSGVKDAPPATAELPGQPAGAPPPAPAESPPPPSAQ